MRLNLQQVLGLAGVPKATFDARRRRGLHAFLDASIYDRDDMNEYYNTRNKWGIEHVVALACVEAAVEQQGISLDVIDKIVSNTFGRLAEAVSIERIDPDENETYKAGEALDRHFFVGCVFFEGSREHVAGPFGLLSDAVLRGTLEGGSPNPLTSIVAVDATTIYRQIKAKMFASLTRG